MFHGLYSSLALGCVFGQRLLRPNRMLRFYVYDLPNFYHRLHLGLEQAKTNPIGPATERGEIPQEVPCLGTAGPSGLWRPCNWSVVMGDKKAVAVAHEGHRQMLLASGLTEDLMVGYGERSPPSSDR